ncbi:ADP-ribosylation factor-like protein 14 [Astyanax mexicanus]|uniref:ADP-ribosylation factor-like protein 14 n=1 Tax=Astyanax mexicanus TaxID=7994 RepID=A0A8T2M4G0_ASTMX|nr:ADP-ribosylation factor-like protein 14 [Astyanax mexicanus]KAG9278520.1 ADP-ribosylation factor-like protein 14 [Astyanax mexicanus]
MGSHSSKVPLETQILILGLDGSGKSTLLYKLKYNEAVVTVPTVGFNVEMLETKEKGCTLTVWDVGGQSQMRAYWKHYYQDSSGLVYVVDSHDQNRLSEAKQELEQILEHEELESKPLIVLANKQDLPGAANADDIAETLNLKEICGNRNWLIQPCSGRTGEGLENCFRKMVHLLKTAVVNRERGYSNRGFSLKERNARTSTSSVKSVT